MKKITYVFIFLFLILIVAFNTRVNNIEHKPNVHPENIPDHALWVGGVDGGVYIIISKSENDKPPIYDAIIYYESGNISYKGKLAINSIESPLFDYKNSESYSAWDGDTLYLRDSRYLKTLK